jgi:hypothetical protein
LAGVGVFIPPVYFKIPVLDSLSSIGLLQYRKLFKFGVAQIANLRHVGQIGNLPYKEFTRTKSLLNQAFLQWGQ